MPKTMADHWVPKIVENVVRNKPNHDGILAMNWNLIILWECELKKDEFHHTMDNVISSIQNYKNRK
jgi:DNA mismatch endonuclease (patch repair protein)